MKDTAIISTVGGGNHGLGHIQRSLWLAELVGKEFGLNSSLIVNRDPQVLSFLNEKNISYQAVANPEEERKLLQENPHCAILIVDKRDTDTGIYSNLPCLTIGIDNYGTDSRYFDFLISPLPHAQEEEANFSGLKYLLLPAEFWKYRRHRMVKKPEKILISFGGSDPADLSYLMVRVLERMKEAPEADLVLGPLYRGRLKEMKDIPENIKIHGPQETLYPLMDGSDLIITSFGITAYEASILGIPVFTVNPTDYHQNLSGRSGFPGIKGDIKAGELIREKLEKFAAAPFLTSLERPSAENLNLKILLKKILQRKKRSCPVCGEADSRVMRRSGFDNHFLCERDSVFFHNPEYTADISYSSNYFLDDYKKQYGKTYEEDRENIDRLNTPRLEIIRKYAPKRDRMLNLLEVGCAMGFFMDMARQTGEFDAEGVEISAYAANYAKHKLGLKVHQKNFLEMDFSRPHYDVVAMWYYLEHNREMEKLVELVRKALKPGGILALSTPNADGISARKDRKGYATRIPRDHYVEFSPLGMNRFMQARGFVPLYVRTTGIHPKRWIKQPYGWVDKVLAWWMGRKKMGDTFEAYFQKVK
jgi:spore coat polysaccharide biosynthesis predicted glycosyltransferase SpsG/2-polyprenyl-3-methyl-5-hydroxy-6-metoxy-1,4-benzoquinol methylase